MVRSRFWRGLCLLTALACSAPAAPDDQDLRVSLDRYLTRQLRAQRLPGLAIAVTRGSKIVFLKGYGGGTTPIAPDSQFLVASVSKSFAALAALRLAQTGRLDLNAPVTRYLPDFRVADPAFARGVTVRDLLQQRSGLADAGYFETAFPAPRTLAERVAHLRAARPVAPPGTVFHYFNPNYAVLARVLEVVGGAPFDAALKRQVFGPLGMRRTFAALSSAEARQRAVALAPGHLPLFGFALPAKERDGFLGGDAGVVTTASDLARYLIAQNGDGPHPIGAAIRRALHTPPAGEGYAMGWYTASEGGAPAVEHNGILGTYAADLVLLPAQHVGVALLYNLSGLAPTSLTFPALRAGVMELLLNRPPAPPPLSLPALGGWTALLGAALLAWPLLWLRAEARRVGVGPGWRRWPGTIGAFVPAALLAALPRMGVQFSGRFFGWTDLFRAAPDLFAALIVWALLCALVGLRRLLAAPPKDAQAPRRPGES